jgi:hypothetical protein
MFITDFILLITLCAFAGIIIGRTYTVFAVIAATVLILGAIAITFAVSQLTLLVAFFSAAAAITSLQTGFLLGQATAGVRRRRSDKRRLVIARQAIWR